METRPNWVTADKVKWRRPLKGQPKKKKKMVMAGEGAPELPPNQTILRLRNANEN